MYNMYGEKVAILYRCEQNRYFDRHLSWYGVVNSNKTHLGDVALILLCLLNFTHVCVLNISVSINVVRWVFKCGHYTCPSSYKAKLFVALLSQNRTV